MSKTLEEKLLSLLRRYEDSQSNQPRPERCEKRMRIIKCSEMDGTCASQFDIRLPKLNLINETESCGGQIKGICKVRKGRT